MRTPVTTCWGPRLAAPPHTMAEQRRAARVWTVSRRFVAPTFLGLVLGAGAMAQSAAPPSIELPYPYDSGWVRGAGAATSVVASKTIVVQGAPWMRLRFESLVLGVGVTIRLTSFRDGAVQELDGERAREWANSCAYFNGDALQLDLVAEPDSEAARVVLRSVWSGPLIQPQFTICGPADDRVSSSDPRIARLLPVGCTGWIFEDPSHCMSTAGHCAGSLLQVVQFDVPPSDASGAMQHPPPQEQYAVDPLSIQRQNGGLGEDWAYFGCFPNSTTALTPHQRQREAFVLAPAPLAVGAPLRVTGMGIDLDTPTASYTQQTHVGALVSLQGTTLRHDADTTGGNSGSPIQLEGAGSLVVGVHTHGGCTSSGTPGGNYGTSAGHAGWALARAQPTGVCAPTASVSAYCTAKLNSLGCLPTLSASGQPSAAGGAGSFVLHANSLLNQRLGFFMYGSLPRAAPFQGGVLCVAPPRRRTPQVSTAGAAAGADCSGGLSYDMGAQIALGADPTLAFGSIVYVQCWSRDPFDPAGASLSAGLRFTVGP